jgi:hypothetical protein
MGASITLAGESLISQKQSLRQPLLVSKFILANVPGLDTTLPVDRAAGVPLAEYVVHSVPVTREGYLGPNKVVYSLLLGTDTGDFDFNWMGLLSAEDVLVIAAYVPRQQKRREIPPLQAGNNLTRNIVLEYDGAQTLTGITVPANTWQFDFTAEFTAIRADIAQLKEAVANPNQAVSLDGPVLVYPGTANTYKITDYSRFGVFKVSTSVGTVTIATDTITLNIPAGAAAGVVDLVVTRDGNPEPFRIALGASSLATPTITSPGNLATDVGLGPILTASPFLAYPSGADAQTSADWRIKNAAGAIVWSSMGNTVDKTSITLPAGTLQLNTTLFPEVRYNGTTLGSTAWSSGVQFTTAAKSITAPAITSPANGATGIGRTPKFTSTAFSTSPANSDTHKFSNWRLKNALGNIVWSSMNDPINLINITLPSGLLTVSGNWTIEVQHVGYALPDTAWSPVCMFTTAAVFEFGKYMAVALADTPFIAFYGQDIDTFTKLPNPATLPASTVYDTQFNADGTYAATVHNNPPYITAYKRTGDAFAKLANPAYLPSNNPFGVALSPDGTYMAVLSTTYPYLMIYKRTGDAYAYLASNAPVYAELPAAGYGADFSADGNYLVVAGGNAMRIYKRTDDVFALVSNTPMPENAQCTDVAFSNDGLYVACVPALQVFKRNGDSLVALSFQGGYPTGNSNDIAFSPDGIYMAVAHAVSPYITLFKRNADSKYVKLPAPAVLPGGDAFGVAFSADGLYLSVAVNAALGVLTYKRDADTFTKLPNPATVVGGAMAIALCP